jgi:hypothetical protein
MTIVGIRDVQLLNERGIAHRYEEFPDNHTGVDYRMDESLPLLAQALSGGSVGSGPVARSVITVAQNRRALMFSAT